MHALLFDEDMLNTCRKSELIGIWNEMADFMSMPRIHKCVDIDRTISRILILQDMVRKRNGKPVKGPERKNVKNARRDTTYTNEVQKARREVFQSLDKLADKNRGVVAIQRGGTMAEITSSVEVVGEKKDLDPAVLISKTIEIRRYARNKVNALKPVDKRAPGSTLTSRRPTIRSRTKELVLQGLTDEEIFEAIKDEFRLTAQHKGYVGSYRRTMTRNGEI